jgi:hypothetical protein
VDTSGFTNLRPRFGAAAENAQGGGKPPPPIRAV